MLLWLRWVPTCNFHKTHCGFVWWRRKSLMVMTLDQEWEDIRDPAANVKNRFCWKVSGLCALIRLSYDFEKQWADICGKLLHRPRSRNIFLQDRYQIHLSEQLYKLEHLWATCTHTAGVWNNVPQSADDKTVTLPVIISVKSRHLKGDKPLKLFKGVVLEHAA